MKQSNEDITQQDNEDITQQSNEGVAQQSNEDITQQSNEGLAQQSNEDITQQDNEYITQQSNEDITQQDNEYITQQSNEDMTQQDNQDMTQQDIEDITQQDIEDITQQDNESITYNNDLKLLLPVSYRHYITKRTVKAENLNKLVIFLKKYKKLHNVSEIEKRTALTRSTIYNWHSRLHEDPSWSPIVMKRYVTRKSMTDLLEDSIMQHIIKNFLSKGLQFNDRMCKSIALQFWESFPEQRLRETFHASYSWIRRFKNKYDIVNRQVHYKRRPAKTEQYIQQCQQFYKEIQDLYKKHKDNNTLHLMINIDETSWKCFNFGELTWSSKGAEHVEFSSVFNDKECITAIAAITAEPSLYKLPLCIIRKGKSNRAKKVFADTERSFQLFISENGWTTKECFSYYLIWLREELNERYSSYDSYSNDTPIDLILDMYTSHITNELKLIAKKLNFNLHFIPPGATDTFQPLDRYVFGALKNMARAMFYDLYVKDPNMDFTINDSIKILIHCWFKLSNKTIAKAWDLYCDPDEDKYDQLIRLNKFDTMYNEYFTNPNLLDLPSDDLKQTVLNDVDDNSQIEEDDYEEDNIDYEEDNIDYEDSYINQKTLPISIIEQINYDEEFETFHVNPSRKSQKSIIPCQFIGILNTDYTCYINVTLQTIASIPQIRNELPAYCLKDESEPILHQTMKLLDEYDSCTKSYFGPIDKINNISFEEDVSINIHNILSDLQYGLLIEDGVPELFQYIFDQDSFSEEEDKSIWPSFEEILDMRIQGKPFSINKLLFFQKTNANAYNFPSSFWYHDYYFIAKAFISNIDNNHYISYIRNCFTPDFYQINDEKIKKVEWNSIISDETIIIAMYLVYKKSSDDSTKTQTTINDIESINENEIFAEECESIEYEIDLQTQYPEIYQILHPLKITLPPKRTNKKAQLRNAVLIDKSDKRASPNISLDFQKFRSILPERKITIKNLASKK